MTKGRITKGANEKVRVKKNANDKKEQIQKNERKKFKWQKERVTQKADVKTANQKRSERNGASVKKWEWLKERIKKSEWQKIQNPREWKPFLVADRNVILRTKICTKCLNFFAEESLRKQNYTSIRSSFSIVSNLFREVKRIND